MRGASADSLATLTEALGAAVDGGADADRLAEELFAVSRILREEPGLRRTATDVSIPAEAKAELVRSIFGDKLDEASLDLAAKAVGLRWAGTRDLGDSLEYLGVVAVVKGADAADQGDLLEDELFAFGRLVTENPELRDALSDPVRSPAEKRTLLQSLLEGKVTAATLRLAEQATSGLHRTVTAAIEEYQKVAAQNRNRVVATVRVAHRLSDDELERLKSTLAEQYEKAVHMNVVVEPALIGGLKVEIGDDVIDGSVATRLDEARRRLAG